MGIVLPRELIPPGGAEMVVFDSRWGDVPTPELIAKGTETVTCQRVLIPPRQC